MGTVSLGRERRLEDGLIDSVRSAAKGGLKAGAL